MDYEKKIEIPFGAFDSELIHQEINIPNGFKAVIKGNKIILTRAESEDEEIKKAMINFFKSEREEGDVILHYGVNIESMIAWLEKQDPKKHEEELEKAYKTADEVQYRRGYEDATKEMEKQGESYTKRDVDNAYIEGMASAKRELEKQDEQKPIIEMKSAEESLDISSKEYNDIVNDCLYGEPKPVDARENLTLDGDLMEADCMIVEQKSWSEEDDVMIYKLLAVVELYYDRDGDDLDKQSCIDWLKALKQRIGG